jgi:hypothetical protein
MAEHLERTGFRLLGDGGYHHSNIIAPRDCSTSLSAAEQRFLRGLVEIVNAYVHAFDSATLKFHGSIKEQLLCLICVYEFVVRMLSVGPIRPFLADLQQSNHLPPSFSAIVSSSSLQEFDERLG